MVIAENGLDLEPGSFEPFRHLGNRQRPKRQVEAVLGQRPATSLAIPLSEDRQLATTVLMDRFDEREMPPTR